jgi:integrase
LLTDAKCRSAKGAEKPYKLGDQRGLYLYVSPTGHRSWRWKYRFDGKEKRLVFGSYPDVKLAEAREQRDEAAKVLRSGQDPAAVRRQVPSLLPTFEKVATDWHALQKVRWAPRHAEDVLESLKRGAFPKLGQRPIDTITAPDVLEVLREIERRGAIETAHRIGQRISAVFVFAIASGIATQDPAAVVKQALQPVRRGRQPALRSMEEARALLSKSEAEPGQPLVKIASRLLALTAVRPGIIRLAQPGELEGLDGAEPIWRIPAAKMKLSLDRKDDPAFEFLVPLSSQAVELFRLAVQLTKPGPYLFPSVRHAHRPMSDATIGAMYNRLPAFRGRHVPHGWRATFSTVMNELAEREDRPGDRAVIDLMLAHVPAGVESAYNRAAYMPRRREIAQRWADLLYQDLPPVDAFLEGKRR